MSQTKIVVKRVSKMDLYKVAKISNPKLSHLDDLDKTMNGRELKEFVRTRQNRETTVEVLNDA